MQHPIKHPIKHPVKHPVKRPVKRPIKHPIERPIKHPIERPMLTGVALSVAICACLSTVPLRSQSSIVSPAGLTNAYGGINNSIPWGGFLSAEQFCQQIHDDLGTQVLALKGMAFRHYYTQSYAARSYDVELTLGEAATTSSGISTTFTNNWKPSGQKTLVLKGTVSWPARGSLSTPPAPFDSPISFSSTYLHLGKSSLMWQVYIKSNSSNSPTHFFERGPGSTHVAGVVGQGCAISGNTTSLASSGSTNTTRLSETLANGPTSGSPLVAIGVTSPNYGGKPLPISLGGGCFLNISLLLYLPASTTTTFTVPYTWSASLAGLRFRTQWAVNDQGQLKTSNGLDHSIPYSSAWPTRRVYATSFGTTLPTTGSIQSNGLVAEFRR